MHRQPEFPVSAEQLRAILDAQGVKIEYDLRFIGWDIAARWRHRGTYIESRSHVTVEAIGSIRHIVLVIAGELQRARFAHIDREDDLIRSKLLAMVY